MSLKSIDQAKPGQREVFQKAANLVAPIGFEVLGVDPDNSIIWFGNEDRRIIMRFNGKPHGCSVKWQLDLDQDEEVREAYWKTLEVGKFGVRGERRAFTAQRLLVMVAEQVKVFQESKHTLH